MNYMIKGIQALKESFFLGIIIYIVIFVLLYLFKKRRTISWNYMFEGIFCIYCVTLLNLTGIFTLSYSLNGPFNYNLLPFIGSSIVPILLNFALFFPLGFLLPLIFRSCRGNWKKVAIISGLISFLIELLQLFGGNGRFSNQYLGRIFRLYCLYRHMRKKDKSPKSSCFHCYTMFDPCTLFDWNLCSGGQ